MSSKPLNRDTFLSDIAGRNALVICSDIDVAAELLKASFVEPRKATITFTTDVEDALSIASQSQDSTIVFTIGSMDTVTTF